MAKKSLTAVLVRGESFTVNGQVFKRGQPQPISAETRRYLEQHATDHVFYPGTGDDGEGEVRVLPKFQFSAPDNEETADDRA